jgi:hypothetical protein
VNDVGNARQKWPTVLASVSLLYAVLYGLMYLRSTGNAGQLAHPWGLAIVAAMLIGAAGLFIRKSWATRALQLGSWFALAQTAYALLTVCAFMGGPPPMFVLLGMLTVMLPIVAWPAFLLIWLWRHSLDAPTQEPGI